MNPNVVGVMMKVAVGSLNPTKVKGVKEAYIKVFGERVIVIPTKVHSHVSPQPLSLEETLQGAINRAKEALSFIHDSYHGVGIEAGLFRLPTGHWIDVQVAVIISREGRMGVGIGPAFPIPEYVIRRVTRDFIEMEKVMEEISGVKSIGEKMGAIGFLTNNIIKREDLTRIAVLMALIPFMPWNKDYY